MKQLEEQGRVPSQDVIKEAVFLLGQFVVKLIKSESHYDEQEKSSVKEFINCSSVKEDSLKTDYILDFAGLDYSNWRNVNLNL